MTTESFPADGRPDITPAGSSNEQFDFLEIEAVEYQHRPRTVEQFYSQAGNSMRAIAVMAHNTFPERTNRDDHQRVYKADEHFDEASIISAIHRPEDARSVKLDVPGAHAYYTQGNYGGDGEFQQVLKLQREPQIPDIDDDQLTVEQQMELFTRYRAELSNPTELNWLSTEPNKVYIEQGSGGVTAEDIQGEYAGGVNASAEAEAYVAPDAAQSVVQTELTDLPVDELVRWSQYLRKVALFMAMKTENHAVLDRLQYVEEP